MNDYLYEVAKRLVAFDTVSAKSDRDAIDYLAAELAPRGFKTALQPIELFGVAQANLVAWIGPPRADGLIISGHVDVVPFDGQPGWERDPLKLELAGEKIYGRGTTDMKGFIAQCLDAARTLDSSRLKRPLVFVFTASEEVGCLGAHSVAPALEQILGETPVPRLAWIGEPTSWQVSHAHKSIVSFGVTTRGIGGHSGAPARGVNAIAVMSRAIDIIGRYQQELAARRPAKYVEIFPDAPCDVLNLGTIHGGIALNMIAEECTLRISYRSLPDSDPLDVYHESSAPARRARRPRLRRPRASRENRNDSPERRASARLTARNGSGSRSVRRHRREDRRRRALRHRRRMVHRRGHHVANLRPRRPRPGAPAQRAHPPRPLRTRPRNDPKSNQPPLLHLNSGSPSRSGRG